VSVVNHLPEDLTTINVKDVDENTWRHFMAQAIIRGVKAGELLSKVLKDWLAKEAT